MQVRIADRQRLLALLLRRISDRSVNKVFLNQEVRELACLESLQVSSCIA
jgi:hypothetical protein